MREDIVKCCAKHSVFFYKEGCDICRLREAAREDSAVQSADELAKAAFALGKMAGEDSGTPAAFSNIRQEAKGLMKVCCRMIWAREHGLRVGRDDATDGSAYVMRLAHVLGLLPEINGAKFREYCEQLTGLSWEARERHSLCDACADHHSERCDTPEICGPINKARYGRAEDSGTPERINVEDMRCDVTQFAEAVREDSGTPAAELLIQDCAALLRLAVRKLKKGDGSSQCFADKIADFLKRKGLKGSILRAEDSGTAPTSCREGWIECENDPCERHKEYWARYNGAVGAVPEKASIGREDAGTAAERQQPSKLHNEGSNPSSPSKNPRELYAAMAAEHVAISLADQGWIHSDDIPFVANIVFEKLERLAAPAVESPATAHRRVPEAEKEK